MNAARLLALTLVFAAAVAVGWPLTPGWASQTVIKIGNFTFTPAEVTIKAGDTVVWKNDDDLPHSVVASGSGFRSKALDTDETFSMNFTEVGEVEYFCGLHPQMKGRIIVKP
jgi:plastocyanin